MPGVPYSGSPLQRGNLISGQRDVAPALQQLLQPTANQYMPQQQSQGFTPPAGQGGGLEGAAHSALQTFHFRRNFAEGGLVGAPQAGPAAAAPVQGPQLQQMAQQVMQSNPQVVQHIQQAIMQALQSGSLTVEQLQMAVQMAKAAAQNPELYPRLREVAIQSGLAGPDELPPQYDQGIVFAILLAGEAAQQAMQGGGPQPSAPGQKNFAEGGAISPRRSPTGDKSGKADDISINVSGGEFVIPKHIVAAKGTEFFEKMVESYDPNNPDAKVNKPK